MSEPTDSTELRAALVEIVAHYQHEDERGSLRGSELLDELRVALGLDGEERAS
jgi:hypothetical protein